MIELLKRKQEELGLSDNKFARELGITQAMWSLLKSGKRQPGWKVKHYASQRFPEFAGIFLAREVKS